MRLRDKDLRLQVDNTEGGECLGVSVRRSALRPTSGSIEILRHEIAQALGLGEASIIKVPCPSQLPKRGPLRILNIPLGDAHVTLEDAFRKTWNAIKRIAGNLKVASPRQVRGRRIRDNREHPLPRRLSPHASCGGAPA